MATTWLHEFPLRRKGEKAPFELTRRQPKGIIPKLVGNAISALRKVKSPPDQVAPRIANSLATDFEEEMASRMTSGGAGYAHSVSRTLIYSWPRLRRSRCASPRCRRAVSAFRDFQANP